MFGWSQIAQKKKIPTDCKAKYCRFDMRHKNKTWKLNRICLIIDSFYYADNIFELNWITLNSLELSNNTVVELLIAKLNFFIMFDELYTVIELNWINTVQTWAE